MGWEPESPALSCSAMHFHMLRLTAGPGRSRRINRSVAILGVEPIREVDGMPLNADGTVRDFTADEMPPWCESPSGWSNTGPGGFGWYCRDCSFANIYGPRRHGNDDPRSWSVAAKIAHGYPVSRDEMWYHEHRHDNPPPWLTNPDYLRAHGMASA